MGPHARGVGAAVHGMGNIVWALHFPAALVVSRALLRSPAKRNNVRFFQRNRPPVERTGFAKEAQKRKKKN